MKTHEIEEAIHRLRLIVKSTPNTMGVALGSELYAECVKRGLLTLEVFEASGTMLFGQSLPALNKSLFAFDNPFIEPWSFVVGDHMLSPSRATTT